MSLPIHNQYHSLSPKHSKKEEEKIAQISYSFKKNCNRLNAVEDDPDKATRMNNDAKQS